MREVLDDRRYIAWVGSLGECWRRIPLRYRLGAATSTSGAMAQMNFALVQLGRYLDSKDPCPRAGIIDSRRVT